MKNYSSLSNTFNLHNNNNNYKNRKPSSNQNRMLSSFDLNKNKANNKMFDQLTNNNFNPSQTHNDFYIKRERERERNSSIGNNMINYYIPKTSSQYNLNMLKKMNNKYERENLNVMNDNNSIKLPKNYMNNYSNSRFGFPLSNNNNIRLYNRKNNNINTSPNDNMDLYGNNDNSYNQEENENEDDIENITNEIDEYNNNNGIRYNILMQNKILNNHINKLKEENFLMESKGNEIIKVNEELLNENKLLNQKINQLSNYIRNSQNTKTKSPLNNNNNNKDQLIQKLEKENIMLKMNYNKILKQQQKNAENNIINKNNTNIKEINYYKNELNKIKEQLKKSQKILNEKDLIIKEMNQKLFSLNDEVNENQQKFNENNNFNKNDQNEINELKNTIEKNNKIINENKMNTNKYISQIKELKEQLEQKNTKINEIQKTNQLNQLTIDDLKNKLQQNEINSKNFEKMNSELKIELNQKKENEDINTSFVREKISELEENNDALKKKNEELLLKLDEKNKEIEAYKNRNPEENNNKEQYELLQEKYKNALKDCENYKIINDLLVNENNKNKEILSEYDKEKETMNKSLELLKQKNAKYENEIKLFRKTEKNPFNIGSLELDPIKKEEFRYSLGAKEAKTEKYKKMILDYETQNKNDLNQMNMLKEDIKGLKNKLKEKKRMVDEIKNLIETGYKGINGNSKTQKDAIKKLKDILNNNE